MRKPRGRVHRLGLQQGTRHALGRMGRGVGLLEPRGCTEPVGAGAVTCDLGKGGRSRPVGLAERNQYQDLALPPRLPPGPSTGQSPLHSHPPEAGVLRARPLTPRNGSQLRGAAFRASLLGRAGSAPDRRMEEIQPALWS